MPAAIGRATTFYWGTASPLEAVAGVREKSVNFGAGPVDVTSDEDSGWRTLLTVAGQQEVNMSVSGILKSNTLKTDMFAGNRTKVAELVFPDGGVITGDFYLASYEEGATYNGEQTFTAELQSTGSVSYTPPSP
jgi:TP901-1 family phage major tail protein